MATRIKWYGEAVQKKIHLDVADKVMYACLQVERDAKLSFGPFHQKGTSTPSQPGEPPAVTTGELRRSITHDPVESRGNEIVGRVGTNLKYAMIQELGGWIYAKTTKYLHFVIDGAHVMVKQVYLPARSYLRRALDANEIFINRLFGR